MLAAGDPARRSCRAGRTCGQSKMTTLLAIVRNYRRRGGFTARLQLAIAWANILLQRPAPAAGALNRFRRLGRAELPEATQANLRSRPMRRSPGVSQTGSARG